MKMRDFGEAALVSAFSEIYHSHPGIEVGIGDDAAVVAPLSPLQIVTTDMASDGVHFNRQWSTGRDIGAKIAIANLADIYAMGGIPKYLLVAIAIPADEEVEFLLEIARGIEEIASDYGVAVIGGDVIASTVLTISITAIGSATSLRLRSGAKAGDIVYVTRAPGKSLGGLLLLSQGKASSNSPEVRVFQRPDFHPEDLIDSGLENFSALMDVSDGLLADLPKIAQASGVQIDIDIDESRLTFLKDISGEVAMTPLELFLKSGEEHSFIVCVPPDEVSKVSTHWIRIGTVSSGQGITLGRKPIPFPVESWHW